MDFSAFKVDAIPETDNERRVLFEATYPEFAWTTEDGIHEVQRATAPTMYCIQQNGVGRTDVACAFTDEHTPPFYMTLTGEGGDKASVIAAPADTPPPVDVYDYFPHGPIAP